jgi:aspartate/methionine/tyrosine aminotransferase
MNTSKAKHNSPPDLPSAQARATVLNLGASKIREVANAGMGKDDVLAFWFGEPDSVTPAFIREAAKLALDGGDTFYRHNLGLAELREALANYLSRSNSSSKPRAIHAGQIAVTSSGVSALMLAAQTILEPGDKVVAVVPLWPNLTEIPAILNAKVERHSLDFSPSEGWTLDLEKLLERITDQVRAVFINSPNNPSGWTMSSAQQAKLLAHCREKGVWILSDEAYDRIVFDGSYQAPSMLDHVQANDRVLVANTFSKTWQMTGWRLGWLVGPASVIEQIGKLIEFNTSCAPGFVQKAGLEAVLHGEASSRQFVDQLKLRRDHLLPLLTNMDRIQVVSPPGAMYLFFKVAGMKDSLETCKLWVRDYGLGLAPGAAFGEESAEFIRWCFAKSTDLLDQGAGRLQRALQHGAVQ